MEREGGTCGHEVEATRLCVLLLFLVLSLHRERQVRQRPAHRTRQHPQHPPRARHTLTANTAPERRGTFETAKLRVTPLGPEPANARASTLAAMPQLRSPPA
eukprot:3517689-Rhodomonas_salina.2